MDFADHVPENAVVSGKRQMKGKKAQRLLWAAGVPGPRIKTPRGESPGRALWMVGRRAVCGLWPQPTHWHNFFSLFVFVFVFVFFLYLCLSWMVGTQAVCDVWTRPSPWHNPWLSPRCANCIPSMGRHTFVIDSTQLKLPYAVCNWYTMEVKLHNLFNQ